MNATIQIAKHDLSVSLHPATVIHANKYTETSGGWYHLPVFSTLYTDVVFRSKKNGQDWPIYIKRFDLPIYTNQDVTVIAIDDLIMGYIDNQTEYYYYTDTDFFENFKLGISRYKAWLIGTIASALGYFIFHDREWILSFIPLITMLAFYHIQKLILNNRTTKALDDYLTSR